MTYLITILDFLFLTAYVFWPLLVISICVCYSLIDDIVSDGKSHPISPWFWGGLFTLGVFWHWPALRITDWRVWVYIVLGYVVAGFAVALYKWLAILADFRKLDVAADIAKAKRDANEDPTRAALDLGRYGGSYTRCVIEADDKGAITIYPDWRDHPIGTYWTAWPFFLLSVLFDPIQRLCTAAWNRAKRFFEWLAQRVAVKG